MDQGFRTEFATFSAGELDQLFGQGPSLRLVRTAAASPRSLTVHEVLALTVRDAVAALRRPAPSKANICACVPWALWFALMDVDGAYEIVGDARRADAFERDWLGFPETLRLIAGAPSPEIRRFLLCTDVAEPRLVAELPPAIDLLESKSGFFVDLKVTGHAFAKSAGRPLVTLRVGDGRMRDRARRSPAV